MEIVMFVQSIKMAWESVKSNKMRSFLTMLGIIIGVFALVVLVSIVSGATGSITDSISSLGSDSLTVSVVDNKNNPLTLSQLEQFEELDAVDKVSPYMQSNMTIKSGRSSDTAVVYGVNENYASIAAQTLSSGRTIKKPDMDNHTNVAVVNMDTVRDIMKIQTASEAVGRSVSLGGQSFDVIGVLEEDEDSASSMFMLSSYQAYIPYSSAIRVSSTLGTDISTFVVSAVGGDLSAAQDEVGNRLMKRLDNDEDAFQIMNFDDVLSIMDSVTGTLSLVMGGVAGISLLVGGIGIMNIMLVSVTERTREIGIRKAIGATRRTIMLQFLIEALMISLIGCAIGIALSWLALVAVTQISARVMVTGIAFGLSGPVVAVAVIFSLAIGLIFGLYPANKAARKKPIDALRYNG